MTMQAKLLERFLRYVAVTSQSNAAVKTVPTTEGQRQLAELLKNDLAELGLVDLEISEHSVLTGKLPANLPEGHHSVPAVGWVAHLDTVDVCLNAEIHPHVVKNYQGGDICLNEERQIFLKVSEHPEIEKYIGEDIVVSDGTSVLGAD
ncbi:MAG: peptidase T, partial [Phascolarctobacterium sp.]|nr:peptidase T [Phascolarctobacterium sp.]